jgi:hypothetical protein
MVDTNWEINSSSVVMSFHFWACPVTSSFYIKYLLSMRNIVGGVVKRHEGVSKIFRTDGVKIMNLTTKRV